MRNWRLEPFTEFSRREEPLTNVSSRVTGPTSYNGGGGNSGGGNGQISTGAGLIGTSFVDVTLYGIDRTGKEDCRQKVQDLIYRVGSEGGGKIVFPTGEYSFFPSQFGYGVCIQHSNIEIELTAGARLVQYDPTKVMRNRWYTPSGLFHVGAPIEGIDPDHMFTDNTWYYQGYNVWRDPNRPGSLIMPPRVISFMAPGHSEIYVDNIGIIKEGDWLYVRSTEREQDANFGQQTMRSELVLVSGVNKDRNTIQLKTHILSTYNVKDYTVSVIPLRMIDNFSITGTGTIVGTPWEGIEALPLNGAGENGIVATAVRKFTATGIQFENWVNSAARLTMCEDVTVKDVSISAYRLPDNYAGPGSDAETYGGGYGVGVAGCQFTMFHNIYGENCRHVIDTGVGGSMTRSLIVSGIRGHSSYASVISTHSAVDVIMSDVTEKDTVGGVCVRSSNFLGTNLDIQGNNRAIKPVGGYQIGIWRGGEDGYGDPLSVTHNFGHNSLSNSRITNVANPLNLFGSVESYTLDNVYVDLMAGEIQTAMFVFARRVQHFKMRNCVIDCTNQTEETWAGGILFRQWTATLAERGTIDIQGCTFINPTAYVMEFHGVHEFSDSTPAGDYIIKGNKFIFDGRKKVKPWTFIRFSSGYFNSIDVRDNEVIGFPRYYSGIVTFDVPRSNVRGSIKIQENPTNLNGSNIKQIVTNPDIELLNTNLPRGGVYGNSTPSLGISQDFITTTAGTLGDAPFKGFIKADENTVTIVGAETRRIIAGNYITIPGAGNNNYDAPLEAIVVKREGNVLHLHEFAQTSSGTAANPVTINYTTPRVAPLLPPGSYLSGQGDPIGKELAPSGAIYFNREASKRKVTHWKQTRWDDVNGWVPLSSPAMTQNANDAYAIGATLVIKDIVSNDAQSGFSRSPVFESIRAFGDDIRAYSDALIVPVSTGSGFIGSFNKDFDLTNVTFRRTNRRGALNDKGAYIAEAGRPTFLRADTWVHESTLYRDVFPRDYGNARGIDMVGKYTNLLPTNNITNDWSFWGSTVASTTIPNPFNVPEWGNFVDIREQNVNQAEHNIVYGFPAGANPVTNSLGLTFFVHVPTVVTDRKLLVVLGDSIGTYTVSFFDFSTRNPKMTQGVGNPRIEKVNETTWKINMHSLPPSTVAGTQVKVYFKFSDMNHNLAYMGDSSKPRFYVWGLMLTGISDALPYVEKGVVTSPDTITMPDVDLSKQTVALRLTPRCCATDYRMLAIGQHELWMTGNYRGEFWEPELGIYYKDAKNNVVPVITPSDRRNKKLYCGERISISIIDGSVKIYQEGILRLTYKPRTLPTSKGLTIGGSDMQNFVVDSVAVITNDDGGFYLQNSSFSTS